MEAEKTMTFTVREAVTVVIEADKPAPKPDDPKEDAENERYPFTA
jgi:hypothetical protein